MCKYHSQISLTTTTTVSEAPTQPAIVIEGKSCPTWFRVEHSVIKKKLSPQLLSVEVEYHKYTLSESSSDTDILWFWEVRIFYFLSNGVMTHVLNRPTRKSSQLCLQLLWTTSQSRQHLCLANASSQ
jgi:hypothetical protein